MVDPLLAGYEAVPYESQAISSSDIGRMEAVARLHGIMPPPTPSARVLELGCASGGNLIPMAYRFPDAKFVGIDLAPGQVGAGQAMIAQVGLTNISLHAMSIVDITDDFGMFDYIIVHGVYSWVPPEVQDAILRVCKRNLSPSGVAYISYNTYPGWHSKEMVRHMMLYHDDATLPPNERVTRALDFVDLLAKHGLDPESFHSRELAGELAILRKQAPDYFLHEQMEPYNSPVHFAEFVRRASSKGLRYLAESRLNDRMYVPPAWAESAAGNDRVRAEQYADYAIGRLFRRTLLCHDTLATNARPDASRITELRIALFGRRADGVPTSPGEESYEVAGGATMTTSSPATLAAFHVLERVAPASLSYAELYQRVCDLLSVTAPLGTPIPAGLSASLADTLLTCALGGLIDITGHASVVQWRAGERPVASRVARTAAPYGGMVPTLPHANIDLSPLARFLLPLLDGTADREQLLGRLADAFDTGALSLAAGRPTQADLARKLDATLEWLANAGLLEA